MERRHVGKLNNYDPAGLPDRIVLLWHDVTATLGDVTTSVLGNQRTNFDPMFLKLTRSSHCVLSDQIGGHRINAHLIGPVVPASLSANIGECRAEHHAEARAR